MIVVVFVIVAVFLGPNPEGVGGVWKGLVSNDNWWSVGEDNLVLFLNYRPNNSSSPIS